MLSVQCVNDIPGSYRGYHSPLEGESQKPSRQAKADAVGGGRRATSQKVDLHPLGNSHLSASLFPLPGAGSVLASSSLQPDL